MKPTVRYDPDADAAKITLSDNAYLESEEVAPGIILDFDAEGRMIGIEVLQARSRLAADTLSSAEPPRAQDVFVIEKA
ncbi:DUF2283 domain-containing protein [Acuticoccus sp.]|uniref:DUF2283 domain-containing protein n=1 Tax=Acuticoccus sp. TaxID=1904378 RepID=UPI003B521B1C